MKKLAVLAGVVIALLLTGGWTVWSRIENRLIVRNDSGQAITFLTITVGGETLRFEDIPASVSISSRFHIRSDDSFVVRGQLADGTKLAENCCYVTHGMYGERAEFIIQPGGKLEFKQGEDEASYTPLPLPSPPAFALDIRIHPCRRG